MNKMHLTLIAAAGMLMLGVPSAVRAQAPAASGPFADVPADHWAYQSVDTLQKAGIVIGYPDGTYGGKRAMTRYEFAVAIARLMPLLNQSASNANYATKDDLAALRQDLEQKLQSNSDAIEALRKLVDEFGPELTKLGQDVAAVKDRLDALEARVAAVEEEQRRVKFNGALNIIVRGNSTSKGPGFIDQNGMAAGVGHDNGHILRDTDVFNDFVLGIKGKVSDTATANVKLDFGNYLSAIGNTAAPGLPAGSGTFTSPSETTVWEANLESPVNLGPLGGADLVAGRFGNQWTKYTLEQVDADVYTYLYQTDSGNIMTDGGKVNLNIGPAKVNAWAGKLDMNQFSQPFGGPSVPGLFASGQTFPAGLLGVNTTTPLVQGAGVRATFGNIVGGTLGANFEQFGIANPPGVISPAPPVDPNRLRPYGVLSVYGLDFNGAFPVIGGLFGKALTLDASYTMAPTGFNSHSANDVSKGQRYTATDDQVGVTFGALSLKGGYQYVGPNFTAPGYWGRVGSWTNPSNVEGGVGSAKYVFSPKLTVTGDVESYKAAYGSTAKGGPTGSPLQGGDKLTHYQIGGAYGLTSAYDVDLGYEAVNWDLKNNSGTLTAAGKPTESFVTIGVGHTFNPNASFKLLYQIIQYKDKGTGFSPVPGGDFSGNVAVGQFQVKF